MKEYIGGYEDDQIPKKDRKKSKWSKFVDDLPIYLNGFGVGYLTFGRSPLGVAELVCFGLCLISFIWYGNAKK